MYSPAPQPVALAHAMPAVPPPVAAVTRVRWGRVALVLAGVVLLLFAASDVFAGDGPRSSTDKSLRSADPLDVEAAQPQEAPQATAGDAAVSGGGKDPARKEDARAAAARAATRRTARRAAARRKAARAARARRAARAAAAIATGSGTAAAQAAPAPGTTSAQSLPRTGASAWVAGVLGFLLVAAGLLLHVNACRVGATAAECLETAAGYRRGPALRPRAVASRARRWLDAGVSPGVARIVKALQAEAAPGDYVSAARPRR